MCHAPNKPLAFREQHRLLKPGAEAAIVDWSLTDAFDSANREHMDIRARIERNNVTPELLTAGEYVEAVQSASLEVIEAVDQQAKYGQLSTPWYMALQGRDFFVIVARSHSGRPCPDGCILERLRMAPAGTSEAARILNVAADALVEAGELGIFYTEMCSGPGFLPRLYCPRPSRGKIVMLFQFCQCLPDKNRRAAGSNPNSERACACHWH